ncbi:MAG: hypothetical protein CL470_03940 [Acidimicrobiaceae bacterium]|nr:hypothetical protein [Acidimicrobiaceae bacterium]
MDLLDRIKEFSVTNPEAVPMIYDIMRMVTMQFVVQGLFSANNPTISLFNGVFIQTTLFLCLGIMIFWLIIYKLTSQVTLHPLIKY